MQNIVKEKAPGPNNFSIRFFQVCWEVLKEDLTNVFRELHSNGKFEKSLNAIFIALIIKKSGALEVKDLQPSV